MSEVVTALHRFDLTAAQGLAAQRGGRVFLVDPVLHGRAIAAGIADPLVHTRSTADIAGAAFAEAQRDARALCRDLGQALAGLAPAAVSGAWSGHRIFHLFWTLHGYRRLWPEVLVQHRHARWHVLLPRLAHTYGAHSFVPGLLLLNLLRQQGVDHGAYGFDCPGLDAYQLPDLRRLSGDVELLAHLPTCGHDARHIADELKATGLRCCALTPQVYDVDLGEIPSTGLVDLPTVRALLGAEPCERIAGLEMQVKEVLQRHLRPWLAQSHFLDLQVQALWESLEAQALLHSWLSQHFIGSESRQLLISNHDATIHGVLMSFAHQRGWRITVLPHSRVHNIAIKTDGLAPRCLHHGMQDGPCVDLGDHQLPAGSMRYPGDWNSPRDAGDLRCVGLVLNGVSANGMCMVDFEAYAQAIKQWMLWAQGLGLELKLRVRTVETPVVLLAQRLGVDVEHLLKGAEGSLVEFGRGCDLTLGFDVPTSGLQDLVRDGQAVMQVEFRPLARHEWSIVDERVVPRFRTPEAQERLALMQNNPTLWAQYRVCQHDAARARVAGARLLRDWLAV